MVPTSCLKKTPLPESDSRSGYIGLLESCLEMSTLVLHPLPASNPIVNLYEVPESPHETCSGHLKSPVIVSSCSDLCTFFPQASAMEIALRSSSQNATLDRRSEQLVNAEIRTYRCVRLFEPGIFTTPETSPEKIRALAVLILHYVMFIGQFCRSDHVVRELEFSHSNLL